MSPQSPENCETPARPSLGIESSLGPRLKSIEAQAQVQATEIALLRQLNDDLGSRVDSASLQTARVLQALNRDLDTLKSKIIALQEGALAAANRGAVDELVTQMKDCYRDLQGALGRLKEGEASDGTQAVGGRSAPQSTTSDSVVQRLADVEQQLAMAHVLASEHTQELDLLRSNGIQASAEARAAMIDAAAACESADAATAQVHALRLGLEVVEQSMEHLDATHAVESLRSRMDDLDVGAEHTAKQLADVASGLAELRAAVESASSAAAAADARARCASEDTAALRREMRVATAASMSSNPPSPSPMGTPVLGSDPRVKAAVHTLSDGYRSLHRAMVLMYEEQADVAGRVAAVGAAAMQAEGQAKADGASHGRGALLKQYIRARLASGSDGRVKSHPVVVTPREELADKDQKQHLNRTDIDHAATAEQVVELRVLLAAQAADAARHARRADALEDEIRAVRAMLAKLATTQDSEQLDPASSDEVHAIENAVPLPAAVFGSKIAPQADECMVAVQLRCDEHSGNVLLGLDARAAAKQEDEEWTIRTII
jgi:hypothetical protein